MVRKSRTEYPHLIGFLFALILMQFMVRTDAAFNQGNENSAIVRIWLRTYTYPYKLKANRDWCNPDSPNEPCSPAFQLCYFQNTTSPDTCQAHVKFGGKKTVYANRNTIRFGTTLAQDLYNPISFFLTQWQPYPSLNLTITNDDFDSKTNLIGKTTLYMDKLNKPASTKWRAKWHKVTLRLTEGKVKIILSYQAYYTGLSVHNKHLIHLRRVTRTFEPVSSEPIEDLEETVFTNVGAKIPLSKPKPYVRNLPTTGETDSPSTSTNMHSNSTTSSFRTTEVHTSMETKAFTNTTMSTTPTTEKTTMKNTTIITTTKAPPTTVTTTTRSSTTVTTTESTTTTPTTTMAPNHLSDGAIAGLVVGLSLLVLLLITISVLAYKYRGRLMAGYRPLDL